VDGLALATLGVGLPFIINQIFPGFPEDERSLDEGKRRDIEDRIRNLSYRICFTKPVDLIESSVIANPIKGMGTNFSNAAICINPDLLHEFNDREIERILARELIHIKLGNHVIAPLLIIALSTATLMPAFWVCDKSSSAHQISQIVVVYLFFSIGVLFADQRWMNELVDRYVSY